jgi:hypothetical protein
MYTGTRFVNKAGTTSRLGIVLLILPGGNGWWRMWPSGALLVRARAIACEASRSGDEAMKPDMPDLHYESHAIRDVCAEPRPNNQPKKSAAAGRLFLSVKPHGEVAPL